MDNHKGKLDCSCQASGMWRYKKCLVFPLALAMILILALLGGCSGEDGKNTKEALGQVIPASGANPAPFAVYKEVPVYVKPSVTPYKVEPELANITNNKMFKLSPAAQDLLIKNGFVVVPNNYMKEFFMLYEINRYEPVPNFVTTDSMLHNYHLFFDHLLRVTETEKLAPELKELNQAMLAQAQKQYTALKGTAWENAAKRNLGYFTVGGKLMDPGFPVPPVVKNEVERELALIEKHQGISESPVMNLGVSGNSENALKEDYSQYLPRGHYDKTDLLKAYFKTMMWYGRLTFRVSSEDETRSAVLITLALEQEPGRQKWENIYSPTNFFVGKSDDISYHQFKILLDQVYGAGAGLQTISSTLDKWNSFLEAAGKLEPPAVNSMPVVNADSAANKEILGFRFMGQRFTLDAAVLQWLVYPEVQENSGGQQRMLPKGLDIPAAMGSTEAYRILESTGETDYRNYRENIAKIKTHVRGLNKETWTQNLYWSWLYSLMPLIQEKPQGYPFFMRNEAWARKELTTYLGSWTELKHDTILYAKQVYAEAGGGDIADDRGYVEPNPFLYARLASLVKMTTDGLLERGLLNERDRASLDRMEKLALSLKTISEKELTNTPLTDEEYDLIRSYGAQLEHFWLEALRDEGVDHRSAINDRPAALVADVATNPGGGRVLEEATGHIFEIYVVVPVEGNLRIAKGGVYSHYEFPWPLNDRLTDKKWHNMLAEGQAPPLPEWTKTFTAQ